MERPLVPPTISSSPGEIVGLRVLGFGVCVCVTIVALEAFLLQKHLGLRVWVRVLGFNLLAVMREQGNIFPL